ncbi:hypothetical protein [Amycolatopsis sp. NPDC051903]|uniref:hypothetical protein n=1 Tax=Amycolatopsis sp. NPDC051903 TaxID=3363936 RepID=UPI003798607C
MIGLISRGGTRTPLTEAMLTAPASAGSLAQPVLAFLLGDAIAGPGVTALSAVSHVYGGLAILSDGEVEAVRLGPVGVVPAGLDLTLEAVLLEADGQIVDTATGAALGHPADALANAGGAGRLVVTDGLTPPAAIGRRIAAHFTHLGSVTL